MQFYQDGGLSCIRYYLAAQDSDLEAAARSRMVSSVCHVGIMICQCKAEDSWQVYRYPDRPMVVLACGCNGSSIPVYIGEPPFGPLSNHYASEEIPIGKMVGCDCSETFSDRLAIGIGYPSDIPPLGTLEVEIAQEVVIVAHCKKCNGTFTRWSLVLPSPPTITGSEPWIRIIQGFRFGAKTRWEKRSSNQIQPATKDEKNRPCWRFGHK